MNLNNKGVKMNNSVQGVKTPGPVILYMLNLRKGSEFEAKFNGEKIIGHSGENELALIEEGKRKQRAVKVCNSSGTAYFVEPFIVESFPDKDNILRFHCENAKLS
jgi:hypothetical protein